ncbi:SDR family NAD(P)-dependent oxidoreductase [Bailinhaonella thermotolerans]|uniref:SDR family NAD(P)-dependent oxidoreductase n=1 Tax=Bailinhaonella thermotolerans TaxID=1070861 RepID=A0A3A4AL41_9ACTN|nr:SDR family NAD(P)-dependent oxidoreductase [Bailinhaonella thermotolerans]RJL30366.1 SDR family NAD(P)-dependent oxidoreductase [Bailinhaonella thermotolerans]
MPDSRVVVITGAGGGIGRATAFAFAEAGGVVIAADIDEAAARRTAELASLLGRPARAYRVDVSDAAAMEEFADAVRREHGAPGVVVNNAGIGVSGSFLDTGPEDWRRVIGVNVFGVIHGCRLFAAQMVGAGRRGHIVNVASAAAYLPSAAMPAYATTKAAVLMLTECLRAELAGQGIGVTAVCPGVVNTDITRTTRFAGVDAAREAEARRRLQKAYRRRGYPPEKVADQIVRAVRRDPAILPVTPEARVGLVLSRLSPGLLRLGARLDPGAYLTRGKPSR